jgi:hypothetical protein
MGGRAQMHVLFGGWLSPSHAWAWEGDRRERMASRPIGIIFVLGLDDAEVLSDIPLCNGDNEDFLAWLTKTWCIVY